MDRLELILSRRLRSRISGAGLDISGFYGLAIEIAVFGSRAIEVNGRISDLDVLMVGDSRRRIKQAGLDLICIPSSDLASAKWLESELAGHISKYGVWLKGPGHWRSQVVTGRGAEKRKERRLISLVHNVKNSWTNLHPSFPSNTRQIFAESCNVCFY
jgi:hypothetical protein